MTPGLGAIAVACRRLSIPVHVLIRPRGGDFVPAEAEYEAMLSDIRSAREVGAAGVVLGVLTAGCRVDCDRTARLAEAARPMSVTFHKAFDATPDLPESLDVLIGLGIDRVLTSGGAETAIEGLECLADLMRRARGRIAVLAGGRVTVEEIPSIIGAGLREVHVGSAACHGGVTEAGAVLSVVRAARQAGSGAGPADSAGNSCAGAGCTR